MEISEVQEFYKGTKVFITGATGFVGKVLIEKLLRVTEVDTIYILIRDKKGKTTNERINTLFENPLFDVLKTEQPTHRSRVKAIVGACETKGLNISDSDKDELKANINIVFHSAATVNFNENLKTAYEINVKGTQTILELAKEMKNLKAMVYVSTAFANCNSDKMIEEKVYDYPFDDILDKLEKGTKEDLAASEKIIGHWPNTYTFTKAIAEYLVKKEETKLPLGIFRPSIIVATYKEPIPGWLDNIYALNGISLGILTGFLRVVLCRTDMIIDAVPVDKCVSALAVTPYDIAKTVKTQGNKDIPVYNYTSGKENPLTIGLINHLNFAHGVPSLQAIWYPAVIFVSNPIFFWFLSIILEIIPALLLDALTLLTGKKPRLVSLYMKVLNFMTKVEFFALREWHWENENIQVMWKNLNKMDQELFPFSMTSFSWLFFCRAYVLGIKRYVLKEDDATLPQAYVKYHRFYILHCILKVLSMYMIFYIIHIFVSKIYGSVFAQ